MPFPNYPDKHGASAYLTPEAIQESGGTADTDVPEAIVICYQPDFFEHVVEQHTETEIEIVGMGQLYTLSETEGRIGVFGDFGIGAPTTAISMEQLISLGTETFCIVGGCGAVGRNVARYQPIVCDRAVRDEGVSHHYLPSEKYVSADEALVTRLEDALDAAGFEYRTGASWTTDAIFRETVPEIEYYRDEGVLAVEMEAAAAFAVAEYRNVDAAALLCPFDLVMADKWEPSGGSTVDGLRDLLAPAYDALTGDSVEFRR